MKCKDCNGECGDHPVRIAGEVDENGEKFYRCVSCHRKKRPEPPPVQDDWISPGERIARPDLLPDGHPLKSDAGFVPPGHTKNPFMDSDS